MEKLALLLPPIVLHPLVVLAANAPSSAYQSGYSAGYSVGYYIGRGLLVVGACAIALVLFRYFRNKK